MLPQAGLSVLFAFMALIAVALSAFGIHLRPSRRTLAGAGMASG